MRFVSIDIETTGLDPDTCQVLEIGAVINTPGIPLTELPTFRYRILRGIYRGEPHALGLNRDLLMALAAKGQNPIAVIKDSDAMPLGRDWYGHEDGFTRKLTAWLRVWGIDPVKFVAAGKNFANFDAPFLKKLKTPGAPIIQWHHRILDPGSMYVRQADTFVPDTAECCRRACLDPDDIPGEEHTSIHDALVVVALIRRSQGE
jgi:hypothetical protein